MATTMANGRLTCQWQVHYPVTTSIVMDMAHWPLVKWLDIVNTYEP
jgi:hypothetical protein